MRLTNFMRDAFIRAAMQDVPQIDFDVQAEKVAKDALAKLFNKEFPTLDYVKCSQNAWFNHNNTNTPGTLRSFSVVTPSYDYLKLHDQKTWKVLEDLSKKKHEQAQQRSSLESQLRSVAYSCTTRKALAAALPEFDKYLPADEPAAARNLPVVANVLADFVKAGWPKQNQGMIAAAKAP